MQETWVQSLGWEDPLEKGKATHSVFLPGVFHGLYGVAKSRTRLSDFHLPFLSTTSKFQERLLSPHMPYVSVSGKSAN